MPSLPHVNGPSYGAPRKKIAPSTWVGLIGTLLVALLGLASGGVWSMLVMAALVVLLTALYGLLFRRTTWLRLPRKRSAAALGAGLALVVLLGSGSAFGATHATVPASAVDPAPTVSASPAASTAPHKTPTPSPTPTPTPTPIVTTKDVTETTPIPFESTTVESATLAKGTSTVTTSGVNGVRTTTFRVTLTDGVETSRQEVSETVTTQPVAQVTTIGTYVAPAAPAPAPAPAPDEGGGATALCNDGTLSYAAHHQGACSHHGGVAKFYR